MNDDITSWLRHNAVTMDSTVDAPRGLFDRLRFVADLIKSAGTLPDQPLLLHRDSDKVIHVTPIGPGIIVGRESPSQIIIPDKRLSHQHYQISPNIDGISIRDLQSRNGTWLNGRRITETELRDGDIIEAGGTAWALLLTVHK